jgi:hypothetical protein
MLTASEQKLVAIGNLVNGLDGVKMNSMSKEKPVAVKRTSITRATLELALAEAVRDSDPDCRGLIGIIVERVADPASGGANWALKGVRYGKAPRDPCNAEISRCVQEGQAEFEISD